jgi:16S rRNA (cytosine967-C5)-methyltransferase
VSARALAAAVLLRVQRDGAFAAAALESELSRGGLDPRDRALCTEIVYGALRVLPFLEQRIAAFAKKPPDARTRVHLLVAAYQILFLERVPAFAAVSEAVELVRKDRGNQVAAFANAVLRKLGQGERPSREEAVLASAPAWMRAALARALGEEGARRFLATFDPPPIGLRVEKGSRDLHLSRLRAAAPEGSFEPGRVSPLAILVRGAGKPQSLPGWAEGELSVQEEGSQKVALTLDVRSGERVLDACAGRGNKTSLLARHAQGEVDAADLHAPKLERLSQELARLGLSARTFAVDWSAGRGDVPAAHYDAILLDAPCTGIGTLRRRPELLSRRTERDLRDLAVLQAKILANVSSCLKPGGRLVYAVCSVLREEAEDVLAGSDLTVEDCFRLLPHVDGTDGYFVATLRGR